MRTLLDGWRNFFQKNLDSSALPPGLKSESVFLACIDRQRVSAEQWGRPFTLLLFEVGQTSNRMPKLVKLLRELRREMTCEGKMGRFNHKKIGLLLPNTSSCHGTQILQRLQRGLKRSRLSVSASLHVYPLNDIDKDFVLEQMVFHQMG